MYVKSGMDSSNNKLKHYILYECPEGFSIMISSDLYFSLNQKEFDFYISEECYREYIKRNRKDKSGFKFINGEDLDI